MADSSNADTSALFRMIGAVAPVLVSYTQEKVVGELWHRPGLSPRDRAIVTVCALVSRNAAVAYPHYFNKALDRGVTAAEFSELITHLAFYASWPNAFAAIAVLKGIFGERGVGADQLPGIAPELLALEDAAPDRSGRAAHASAHVGSISPALEHFTDDLLYHEVWRRPGLAPRDRGLATIATLAALGQSDLLPLYLNVAVLAGVTQDEIGEALAHIAFYAGWGNAIQAAGVAKQFFGDRVAV